MRCSCASFARTQKVTPSCVALPVLLAGLLRICISTTTAVMAEARGATTSTSLEATSPAAFPPADAGVPMLAGEVTSGERLLHGEQVTSPSSRPPGSWNGGGGEPSSPEGGQDSCACSVVPVVRGEKAHQLE